jgi:predicted alpha/beta-fold hydrolase
MPIIHRSSYPGAPFYQLNGHLQTIFPAFRKLENIPSYERERIELSDGDFLDLDWIDRASRRLVLLTHGLEGNSDRIYIKGMAKAFAADNWDVLAWNCRSCSGEMNRKLRLYNHGEIGDIGEVIAHALATKDYSEIVMIGFSMGGSISLKYAGVQGANLPQVISKIIAFSTPVNLNTSAGLLDQFQNTFYRKRFLRSLRKKLIEKDQQFPGVIDVSNFSRIKEWRDFDEFFSAPLNGYANAEDFYTQASAINYMKPIQVPTLLVNAKNDPILSAECYPESFCESHPFIYLEQPREGGHVGFSMANSAYSWAEIRAREFVAA